ncbi:TIGR02117 family protein [Novosphingopyxis sp.]|uniref:TIGR02117 family protein n=1 Tax=Novosphingopyxis sp. TaxID=2709690 RepID=UPI003B5A873C
MLSWRLARSGLAWLILAIGLYFGAALAGSLIAVNPGWRQPKRGVEIWVETNGVHTGIVMPLANGLADWRDLLRPEDIRDPRYYSTHILVGWGEARFYRETPNWTDLTPAVAWHAAAGSDEVLMHVDFLYNPGAQSFRRRVVVSEAQYRRLAAAIRAQFSPGADGRAPSSFGYGPNDAFYAAHGHYSAFTTCNAWTGRILRDAGIAVGVWTPMAGGVMRWFPQPRQTVN